jgi:hypothetical protein
MRFILLVLVTALVTGCGASTPIEVTNKSSETIRNIRLSGPGFATTVADLAPGESSTVRVDPKGEAGLAMSFDADTRHIESPEKGYFESGYYVSATVQKDFKVSVDGRL